MRKIFTSKHKLYLSIALVFVILLTTFSSWTASPRLVIVTTTTESDTNDDGYNTTTTTTTHEDTTGDSDVGNGNDGIYVAGIDMGESRHTESDTEPVQWVGEMFLGQADMPVTTGGDTTQPPTQDQTKPSSQQQQEKQQQQQQQQQKQKPVKKKGAHEGEPHELADFGLVYKRETHNVNASTGKIVAVDAGCRWWRYKLRPSVECNHRVHVAVSEIDTPRLVPSGSSDNNNYMSSDASTTSTNQLCRERPADCPVRWISYLSVCGDSANRLADVVDAAGIPLTVLGLGTFWHARWGYRNRVLHDHLMRLPDDLLVVWTDAEDVLPAPGISAEAVMERYAELVTLYRGPRIFFAAETACYPAPGLWSHYAAPDSIDGGRGNSPFRYLNAGIMVGPAGLIRRLIAAIYQDDCLDEQLVYSLAYLDPIVWWRDDATGDLNVAPSLRRMARSADADLIAHTRLPIPDHALPLIGIDHWNVLSAAMWGIDNTDFSLRPSGEAIDSGDSDNVTHADNATTNAITHIKSLHLATTNSTPIILHQSGDKNNNAILEILAQAFGYVYNASKLDEFRDRGKEYFLKSMRTETPSV